MCVKYEVVHLSCVCYTVRKTIAEVSSNLASDGLRVLALASGSAQSTPGLGPLTFAGLIGLHDAPRDGVADAVSPLFV